MFLLSSLLFYRFTFRCYRRSKLIGYRSRMSRFKTKLSRCKLTKISDCILIETSSRVVRLDMRCCQLVFCTLYENLILYILKSKIYKIIIKLNLVKKKKYGEVSELLIKCLLKIFNNNYYQYNK